MSSSFPLPLSENEEKMYVEMMEAGDPLAKDVLIERNLRLVAHIARKYTGANTPLEDLISIGSIGLIKAINEILMNIRASKKNKQEVSISLPIGTDKDGNEISLNDILGTDPDEIVDNLNLKFQIKELYEIIEKVLTPREKEIICLRYGLSGREAKTQREIASSMNISRSYVSRIEKRALEKLRDGFHQ